MSRTDVSMASRFVPLVPLRELIVFPHEVYPIFIGRSMSIRAIDAVESPNTPIPLAASILLVAQRDAMVIAPSPSDMYEVGTLGVVVERRRLPDGIVRAMIEGKTRARVTRIVLDQDFFKAEVKEITERAVRSADLNTLMGSVLSAFDIFARRGSTVSPETARSIGKIDDPSILSDKMSGHLKISLAEQQDLLECASPIERLEKILGYLQDAMSRSKREYISGPHGASVS